MYCDKCGADNSENARFCRKCGLSIDEVEEETRVSQRKMPDESGGRVAARAALPTGYEPPRTVKPLNVAAPMEKLPPDGHDPQDEKEIFSTSPTLLFVKALYVLAALCAVLLVGLTSAFLYQYVSVIISIVIGLSLFLVPAYYHFRQKLVRYRLTETKLEIDTGLIARSTRNIPIRRIQDVTVSSSMFQRLLGFGNVEIDNASEEGGKVAMQNIDSPRSYADMLLKQMSLLDR